MLPLMHLLEEVGGRLSGEWRVGRANPFTQRAVAACAGRETTAGVTLRIEQRRPRRRGGFRGRERHVRIIKDHCPSLARRQLAGNKGHLLVMPSPVRIGDQLPLQIACVETGQPGRPGAVARSVERMARKAGIGGASHAPAQRDQPACLGKLIGGTRISHGAASHARKCAGRHCRQQQTREPVHASGGTVRARPRFRFREPFAPTKGQGLADARILLPLVLAAGACVEAPDQRQFMPFADAARGERAIESAGCASCHTIDGIRWPQGRVGPRLQGFADRALIAGRVPNTPENLSAFVRDAPDLVPGTTMPAMPISEREARDIAAFLYRTQG